VNRLSLKAALLYTWLIPHVDDQGRVSGESATIKAVVCPLRKDIEEAEIPKLLSEMEDMGLIILYSDMRVITGMIQIVNWWDYQALRDPQPSRYPPPEGWNQDRLVAQAHDQSGRFRRVEP
jgi:hypothetical protein